MKNALIVNNKPVCPKCKQDHYEKLKVIDVNVATVDFKTYFEMIMKCRNCDTTSYYFLDLEMMQRLSICREDNETYERIRSEE